LKIADFGLATSGEWIYQESYRSSRRKELLKKYHQSVDDDGTERTLKTTVPPVHIEMSRAILNQEKEDKMHAVSVVGTYYYMAPEVLNGEKYNASADWYLTVSLTVGGP
jgi:serine/threonine protein kinase